MESFLEFCEIVKSEKLRNFSSGVLTVLLGFHSMIRGDQPQYTLFLKTREGLQMSGCG